MNTLYKFYLSDLIGTVEPVVGLLHFVHVSKVSAITWLSLYHHGMTPCCPYFTTGWHLIVPISPQFQDVSLSPYHQSVVSLSLYPQWLSVCHCITNGCHLVISLSLYYQGLSWGCQSVTVSAMVVSWFSVCHHITNGCHLVVGLLVYHQCLPPGCQSFIVSPMVVTWLAVYHCITNGCHLVICHHQYYQCIGFPTVVGLSLYHQWLSSGCQSITLSPMVVNWKLLEYYSIVVIFTRLSIFKFCTNASA